MVIELEYLDSQKILSLHDKSEINDFSRMYGIS